MSELYLPKKKETRYYLQDWVVQYDEEGQVVTFRGWKDASDGIYYSNKESALAAVKYLGFKTQFVEREVEV